MSSFTLSIHRSLGLPLFLFHSTLACRSSALCGIRSIDILSTCPYHRSLRWTTLSSRVVWVPIRHVLPRASPIISGAERVSSLRVLGVVISSDLGISAHLDQVLSSCASSMYALRVLRSHGLQPQMLHEVTKMTTIASLMYDSPAWWGYSSANDRARIDQLLRKLKRFGFFARSGS